MAVKEQEVKVEEERDNKWEEVRGGNMARKERRTERYIKGVK